MILFPHYRNPDGLKVHKISKIWVAFSLEKEMATHSSVRAWRIPGMGEPGGLPSMGLHRVRHDRSDLAVAASRELTRIAQSISGAR